MIEEGMHTPLIEKCRLCRFRPERTLYLAFGHDEEVGGGLGAKAIAEYLKGQGVQLEFVLDEGGPLLVDGLQPFIRDKAVALVGTAEKVLRQSCNASLHPSRLHHGTLLVVRVRLHAKQRSLFRDAQRICLLCINSWQLSCLHHRVCPVLPRALC